MGSSPSELQAHNRIDDGPSGFQAAAMGEEYVDDFYFVEVEAEWFAL